MIEKFTLLLILYAALFIYDGPKLKNKRRRMQVGYGLLMIASVYLSIDYLLDLHAPNLDDVFHFFFKNAVKHIEEAIKLPA
ncbi:hypothetical protein ACFQI7_33465 [Paenibacillus allorhizosphaerae]|uniref:Uncharacterized protein n=1 Tax=Paenibacillus allorhizosphaerae TaxID=2849866 RepID=A0ABN7TT94_9BACL|nr:hypothetical protein [Paenibacillus allorhizosphaerae]CAG7654266.1 hypothetical protein PAECIP111802_05720 [Paenibacillus allorhizosphaerae]